MPSIFAIPDCRMNHGGFPLVVKGQYHRAASEPGPALITAASSSSQHHQCNRSRFAETTTQFSVDWSGKLLDIIAGDSNNPLTNATSLE